MPAAGAVASIAGSILLPMILKALGKKVLPALASKAMTKSVVPAVQGLTRVPAGQVVVKLARVPAPVMMARADLPNKGSQIIARGGQSLKRWPHLMRDATPERTVLSPTAVSKALDKTGSGLNMLSQAGTFAFPLALNLISRGVQGAAVAGGGLASAASKMPLNFTMIPENKRQIFGDTPQSAAARTVAGLGDAAGLGLSAMGNAVGTAGSDIAKTLQAMHINEALNARTLEQLHQLNSMNIAPSTAHLVEQMVRTQGRHL